NYYKEHNISPVLPTRPLVTDTIQVGNRVHFDQISSVLNIPKEELRVLNPQFRKDLIPGTPSRRYTLTLPSQQIHAYILSEENILAYNKDQYTRREEVNPGDNPDDFRDLAVLDEDTENPADLEPAEENTPTPASAPSGKKRTVTHTVAEGESLADIATRYGVSASEIRRANSLRRNAVRPGQKLRVETSVPESDLARNIQPAQPVAPVQPVAPATSPSRRNSSASAPAPSTRQGSSSSRKQSAPATKKKNQPASKKKTQRKPSTHTVVSGDNLSRIAKRNGVSVEDLKKANPQANGIIRPGDKITIPTKGSSSKKKSSTPSKKRKKSSKRR
ncbi:MAG: LysM peptidoglycan-binding domain-containing protein, partial [Muribaculaceae bacterium]|nr:LysM peptidoglycan-binding domain-containing protein [Muribaculaceae bacterium]